MNKVYHALIEILDNRERKLGYYVLLLTIVVAFIEVLGVASIMPFMAVLTNPDVITTNVLLAFLYNTLNFQNTEDFMHFLGICVFVFLVGSTFLKALVVWVQVYFSSFRNFSIGSRLIAGYLRQPYIFFQEILVLIQNTELEARHMDFHFVQEH